MKIKELWNKFVNTLFKEKLKCICCGEEMIDCKEPRICKKCAGNLPIINNPCKKCGMELNEKDMVCTRCKKSNFAFKQCFSCCSYFGEIKNLIYNLKYNNAKYLATPLGNILSEKFKTLKLKIDCVVPVPICEKRRKIRGYNQCELVSKELCNSFKIPMSTNLIRTKETEPQTNKNYKQRQDNLVDAFKVVNKKEFFNKTILIVDDVITTGATLNECAKAILKAKPKQIYCLTIANTKKEIEFEQ